jgi:hypothetical protein
MSPSCSALKSFLISRQRKRNHTSKAIRECAREGSGSMSISRAVWPALETSVDGTSSSAVLSISTRAPSAASPSTVALTTSVTSVEAELPPWLVGTVVALGTALDRAPSLPECAAEGTAVTAYEAAAPEAEVLSHTAPSEEHRRPRSSEAGDRRTPSKIGAVITSVRSEGSTATKRCNALAAACSRSMCALDTPAAVLLLLPPPPPPPPPRSTGTARSTVGVPAASPPVLLLLLLLLTVSSIDLASAPTRSKPSEALGTAPSSLVEPLGTALELRGARLVRRASRHITAINPRLVGIHSITGAAPSSAPSRALGAALAALLLLLLLLLPPPLARCCRRAAASAAARARAPWGKPSGDEMLWRRGVEGEAEGVARSSAPDEGGHQRSSEVIRGHQRSSDELEQRTGFGQLLRRLWRRLVLHRVERLSCGESEKG